MTSTTYLYGPEEALGDLCRDLYVAAAVARQGKLNIKTADAVSSRLRAAASNMIEDSDAELLREAAGRLETLTLRVKAQAVRGTWAKAADVSRRRETSDWLALSHAADLQDMASAGPFSRDDYEATERARSEAANKVLAERRRKDELERRRHVSPEPETPWWR